MWKRLIGLLLALSGCDLGHQVTHYRIQIHCQLPDGKPVAGVQIARAPGGKPFLSSDAQGNMSLPVEGREGQDVSFAIVKIPATMTLTEGPEPRRITLKNYGSARGQLVSTIAHEIRLRPKKETYVVLVSAKQAPRVEVAANGTRVAHLNSRSVAAFRIDGKPGDELKVALLPGDVKGARIQGDKLVTSLTLPESSAILSFQSNLFIKPEPRVVIHTAKPGGAKQIAFGSFR